MAILWVSFGTWCCIAPAFLWRGVGEGNGDIFGDWTGEGFDDLSVKFKLLEDNLNDIRLLWSDDPQDFSTQNLDEKLADLPAVDTSLWL